jgi:hypothetical protein
MKVWAREVALKEVLFLSCSCALIGELVIEDP